MPKVNINIEASDAIELLILCQYWRERCTLAEKCLEESPCDPDITPKQIEAWSNYHAFIKEHSPNP